MQHRRFLDGTDWLITGGTEIGLVLAASLLEHGLRLLWPMSLFAAILLWYGIFFTLTLGVLKIQRAFWPIAPGRYAAKEHQGMLRRWRFNQFLTMNNLFLQYQHSLLPPPARKFFSRLLGAKVGSGIVSISGVIMDPYLITIGAGATVGHDSVLLPCSFAREELSLGRITIGRDAVVGARCLVEHSVSIGDGAMIKAMSHVEAGTVVAPYEVWGGVPARKMGVQPRPDEAPARFMGWRDLVVTPLVQTSLLVMSGVLAWQLSTWWHAGLFELLLSFYLFVVLLTLITLKVIRTVWPFPVGTFSFQEHPNVCYQWNLYAYLCVTHLFLHYQNGLVPIPLRKLFCWFLGANFDRATGLIAFGGHMTDHYAVTIASGAVIGEDTLILSHAITVDSLILDPVRIERGAMIGQRSLIMPGVVIGENSCVSPMSLVTMRTHIPPHERWGGVPARKLGDVETEPDLAQTTPGDIRKTLLPMLLIIAASSYGLWLARAHFALDLFGSLVAFYALVCVSASLVLKGFQTLRPLADGRYCVARDIGVVQGWKAMTFITFTCLTIPYQFGLIPPALRKPLLWLMGARISRKGPATTTGYVMEPHRFEMGADSVLQMNCMILPAIVTSGELHLGRVRLADSVSVGPLSMVLAGATIGSGATVEAMSLVVEDTHIPAGETWGGIPARRRASPSG